MKFARYLSQTDIPNPNFQVHVLPPGIHHMHTMPLKYTRCHQSDKGKLKMHFKRTVCDFPPEVLIGDASWGPTASHMAVKVGNVDTFCMDGWIRSWYLWCNDHLHKHQKHHYRFDQTPGEFIYHAPCLPHSIHVPLTEPLLTIYAWTGQVVLCQLW